MAYDIAHNLLAFGGNLPGGETWSCSMRMTGTDPVTESVSQALCELIADEVDSWFTTTSEISARVTLAWVKFNWIGTDGKYVHAFTSRVDYSPTHNAPYAETHYPNQIAIVVSLHTAFVRGRGSRGRLFLPIPGAAINDSNGVLDASDRVPVANGVRDLIEALNLVTPPGFVTVFSKLGSGAHGLVTGVDCGRVLDTMRSRRTSLVEDRQLVPIVFP